MTTRLRIATFNLENLDDEAGQKPPLADRIGVMRPQLVRLDADVLCLQEVNGQEDEGGGPRRLLALEKLLEGTPYAGFDMASTTTADGTQVFDERNLVVLSRYEIVEHRQYKHDFAPAPSYRTVTSDPPAQEAAQVTWERPLLHARIAAGGGVLNVVNAHLKSKLPTDVPGQKADRFTWKTASGWAEGFFISSMRRVGQALETRMLIDRIFDEDEDAMILVCGDLNADLDEVPVQAIRGDVEDNGNEGLIGRVMIPCERTIPESARFSHLHHGRGAMIDHLLASRNMLEYYKGSQVHNETLHDESIAFATDTKYPEPDHAPVVAEFGLPDA